MDTGPGISLWERALLEIGAGAWFITAVALALVFGHFFIQKVLHDDDWKESPTLRAAVALILFGIGSALRAGIAWYRFANHDFRGAEFILTWWPLFEISIALNAVGAALAIYVLTPAYRFCTAGAVLLIAFAVPALIWWIDT